MIILITFLNGVCRHEQIWGAALGQLGFLNGVCRHEPWIPTISLNLQFLNGVCRHELGGVELRKVLTFLNGVCRHELGVRLLPPFTFGQTVEISLIAWATSLLLNVIFDLTILNDCINTTSLLQPTRSSCVFLLNYSQSLLFHYSDYLWLVICFLAVVIISLVQSLALQKKQKN